MEPFVPIPGKPPRKVVIDRQRKLFASLNIEELLLEHVVTNKFNYFYRESIIKILRRPKLTGCHSNHLMTQNMTVVSQMSGYLTVTMITVALIQFQVWDSGKMITVVDIGEQS
jgi:hypothetical protein